MHSFLAVVWRSKLTLNCKSSEANRFDSDCSAQTVTRIGLLEEIPRSGVQIPCLYLMGHLGVCAPYATRRKLRYEANQVWMNTTFISQGPQSSGI